MSAPVTLTLSTDEALHLQDALDDYISDNCNHQPPSIVRFLQRKLHAITGEALPPSGKTSAERAAATDTKGAV